MPWRKVWLWHRADRPLPYCIRWRERGRVRTESYPDRETQLAAKHARERELNFSKQLKDGRGRARERGEVAALPGFWQPSGLLVAIHRSLRIPTDVS
jgi:hypothetical protein